MAHAEGEMTRGKQRKVVGESPNPAAHYVDLKLSCGHAYAFPVWRHPKGPLFRPKTVRCLECSKTNKVSK